MVIQSPWICGRLDPVGYRHWGWASLFLVFYLLAESQAQTANPSFNPVSRQPLLSLVQVNGNEEYVSLGTTMVGRTDGLEGIVFRENSNGNGSDPGGYIRWQVILRRLDGKAFSRDETLQLSFLATYTGDEPEVLHHIQLRQGAFESQSSFLAPSYCRGNTGAYWRRIFCRVYSDGRELRGLRGFESGRFGNSVQQDAQSQLKWRSVVIGRAASLKKFEALTTDELKKLTLSESKKRWLLPQSQLAVLENLPSDWRELAARPCYAIDADELEFCAVEQTLALRQFVVAGGQLIIAECPMAAGLGEAVESWLQAFVPSATKDLTTVHTKFVVSSNSHPTAKSIAVGFGRIVLCDDELEQFIKPQPALSIFNIAPRLDRLFDTDMMNWMIPKLGQPPVLAFCLSIGAFALIAGPGLLWWTNFKSQRPIWLLMLFPGLAVLITSSIFAYALVHDGFGISGRIRSMTWVDATSGFGCAYSRQTYFSGFPPPTIAFGNTSEVWEVPSPRGNRRPSYNAEPDSDVRLQVVDNRQIYRGLLTPREQNQWMVTTPVEALRPFEWRPASGSRLPRVRNLLREEWRMGFFVDGDRQVYVVDRVSAEADGELRLVAVEDARQLLIEAIPKLSYPVGYSGTGAQSMLDWFSNSSSYRYSTLGSGFSLQVSLEAMIDDWPRTELGKPNRFMILLERAEHLDRPFQTNVAESDSSHLMMGTW